MTKFKAVNNEGRKSTWPPAHGYISISAVTPTSYASCSMLSFFFHAEKAEDGERSDHTYRSRPPPSTPSLQFPRHLCTSLCLQLYNNKALNLRRGVNPSLEKERKRQRKEVEGEKGWVAVEGVAGKRRGEEKRKWDAMKLNHRKGRVGQRRGTD